MTKQSKAKADPQDATEAGDGLTPCQERTLRRIVGRIGKSTMQDYQGGRDYPRLPGDV